MYHTQSSAPANIDFRAHLVSFDSDERKAIGRTFTECFHTFTLLAAPKCVTTTVETINNHSGYDALATKSRGRSAVPS